MSDMDAIVTALEGKLSKRREVKQGMMSVLLTPPKSARQAEKVRLVEMAFLFIQDNRLW